MLFPPDAEPETAVGHSAEVLAFGSAAAASSAEEGETERNAGRRTPRRKPLTPAAE